jgi:transketolase
MKNCNINLERKALQIRKEMLSMCMKAGKGHVSSSFSCVEILVALYNGGILRYRANDPEWTGRDRFVLSKGQASPALYAVLADCGFFDRSELSRFAQKDGIFGVHLQESVPGAELTVGSLGQAYGIAAGLALAAQKHKQTHMVYALLGDGECYEGAIWETAMFAAHYRLNNLVTIIDRNGMCVMDWTENIVALEPLKDKWESFGFEVVRINGHNFDEIITALERGRRRYSQKPLVIIAETVKGYGTPTLCYNPAWHGRTPYGVEASACIMELTVLEDDI